MSKHTGNTTTLTTIYPSAVLFRLMSLSTQVVLYRLLDESKKERIVTLEPVSMVDLLRPFTQKEPVILEGEVVDTTRNIEIITVEELIDLHERETR